MSTKWLRLLATLLALALIAAACGSGSSGDDEEGTDSTDESEGTDEEETTATTSADTEVETTEAAEGAGPTYGGNVSIGLEAEAVGLRPWEDSCSSPCYNMMITIYDKMVEQTVEESYEGYLAESIESNEDFTVWTATLRDGVTFHNGDPLVAQNMVDMFELQKVGTSAAGQIGSANLASVEAPDDLTVVYNLSSPNSAFPSYLARAPLGMVFHAGEAAADPEGFSSAPIGTGPFMMEKRDLDNETVVTRNESYWGVGPNGDQLPYLDSVTFRPIPDEGTRLDALTSGTTDAMQTLRQGTIRDARDIDGIVRLEFQGNNTGGGMYNVSVPPLDDQRVRNGLTMMNNQEAVIDSLGGAGISLPATQWFSPDSRWYSEAAASAWPAFDLEAGAALVQEYIDDPERSDGKAVGDPIAVELSCPPDPTLIAAMGVIEAAWTASGLVDVTLTNFDQQTHINNAVGSPPDFEGVHQAHCWRWSSEDDPSVNINPFLAPPNPTIAEAAGIPEVVSPLNVSNWFDPDSFTAAVGAIQTDDFDTRQGFYEQIMLAIADQTPIWYSGGTATMIAHSEAVVGFNGWSLPSGSVGVGFPNAEGRYHELYRTDG